LFGKKKFYFSAQSAKTSESFPAGPLPPPCYFQITFLLKTPGASGKFFTNTYFPPRFLLNPFFKFYNNLEKLRITKNRIITRKFFAGQFFNLTHRLEQKNVL
jgi:hypothetical protein